MVEIRTKVGIKGQVVIPKVFRNEYNINSGSSVVFREEEGKLVIAKPRVDVVGILRKLPKKPFVLRPDESYEEEIRERLKRAGIGVR
ncbi:MAG: AbrB/MazE/SpoVT family DNA-binding domain-containing protein [Candidatus Aenigmarchaeota archaeon]|nr:AbrB/MazE/SpoVT family DNA-binding domain-containing protein [Candidatus Aenigmarchaeota archaeon]